MKKSLVTNQWGHDELSFGHIRSLPSLARDSWHILNLFIVHYLGKYLLRPTLGSEGMKAKYNYLEGFTILGFKSCFSCKNIMYFVHCLLSVGAVLMLKDLM